jgi:hypothetical protein
MSKPHRGDFAKIPDPNFSRSEMLHTGKPRQNGKQRMTPARATGLTPCGGSRKAAQ